MDLIFSGLINARRQVTERIGLLIWRHTGCLGDPEIRDWTPPTPTRSIRSRLSGLI